VASVIAGATKIEQVAQNTRAIKPLSADDLALIDQIFPGPGKVAMF
jgi:aryl-alcohol dehydrogenase-like predicted oxidoreductase